MINLTGQIAKIRTVAEAVDELENTCGVYSIRGKCVHLSNEKFFELFGHCTYAVEISPFKNQIDGMYRAQVSIDGVEFFTIFNPHDENK